MATKKSEKRRKLLIWCGLVVLVGAWIAIKALQPEPLAEVVVESPAERDVVELISANGRVQPVLEVKIAPEVSGEIVELPIKEGDYVQKGQLLVRIKPDTYVSVKERIEASVNASKAQLMQVEAQLVGARRTYDRQKQLFDQQAISAADFESAESAYNALLAQKRASEFNIRSTEASLKEADEQLYKTTIFAPQSGTISKLNVELGERVVGTAQMAGTELLRLADLAQMEVRSDVNENDIVRVAVGDSASIEVDAYVGRKFRGLVTRVASSSATSATTSADQVTSFEVRIAVDPTTYSDLATTDRQWPMRPGMSATVHIETDRTKAISVPIGAIASRTLEGETERRDVLFLYRADSVDLVPVTTGIQDKQYIVVVGLDTTAKVVVGPFSAVSKELKKGQKVQIKK